MKTNILKEEWKDFKNSTLHVWPEVLSTQLWILREYQLPEPQGPLGLLYAWGGTVSHSSTSLDAASISSLHPSLREGHSSGSAFSRKGNTPFLCKLVQVGHSNTCGLILSLFPMKSFMSSLTVLSFLVKWPILKPHFIWWIGESATSQTLFKLY